MELLEQKTLFDDIELRDFNVRTTIDSIKPVIEAILFSYDEPLLTNKLAEALGLDVKKEDVTNAIDELKAEYETNGKGFQIEEIAGGYQILSKPEFYDHISKLLKKSKEKKISNASLETLAIIAYKQPILRVDIEAIRGVQAGQMIRTLVDMGLVKITGRSEAIGHPLLYGTTKKFLRHFGLKSIKDLPELDDKTLKIKD